MSHFITALFAAAALPLATAFAFDAPLIDEFDDNRHKWVVGEGDTWVSELRDGQLMYENISPEPNSYPRIWIPVTVAPGKSFEVILRVKLAGGANDDAFGLLWDHDPESGAARFFDISDNGWYRLWTYTGSGFVNDRLWTRTSLVKSGDFNELRLKSVDGRVFFFINGQIVDGHRFNGLRGNRFGFGLSAGHTLALDRFEIAYLDGQAGLATRLERDLKAARLTAGPAREALIERFDDNQRDWPFIREGDTWKGEITGGQLVWANRSESHQSTQIEHPINGVADYEITLQARHLAGTTDRGFGVSWGKTSDGEGFLQFHISPDGHYCYWTHAKGEDSKRVISWTKSPAIKVGGDNELKVRKLNDTLFFYLNGRVVADVPAPELPGPRIALDTSTGMTVAFQELSVTYLEKPDAAVEKERMQLIAALEKSHGKDGVRSSVVLAKIAEEERLRAEGIIRDQPSEKDYKELAKVRRQFQAKYVGSLYGSWGRPVDITGTETAKRVYYNFKQIGRTQFYYEFQLMYTQPTFDMHGKALPIDPLKFAIDNINLTDRKW
ncbi:MAG TPA: hypothetical protein VHF69_11590 [Candidatus Synoicihabitans sp.]|nr:hypothetical protein [Candidatus Synoicihabitans sp.]